jgi:dTDP-4-dehydrorhamnose reductase
MKLLVTGRTGQLAQSLFAQTRPELHITLAGRPDFDLARPDQFAKLIHATEPDVVINTAAYTAVDKAESEPQEALRINAIGAALLAQACASGDIPLIHLSTDYVFDGTKASPYLETDPPNPISAYGRTKLEGERLVAAETARHVILRTSWLFSSFGHNFLTTMLRLAQSYDEISVVCDQVGAPTFADHLATAILKIAPLLKADTSGELSGVYHLTAGGETSWSGFAEAIFQKERDFGQPAPRIKPISTSQYPVRAKRPANSRLACTKFESTFKCSLPHWPHGLADCMSQIQATRRPTHAPS